MQISIECVDDRDGRNSVVVYDDKTFPISLRQVRFQPASLKCTFKIKLRICSHTTDTFSCSLYCVFLFLAWPGCHTGNCFWRWTRPSQVNVSLWSFALRFAFVIFECVTLLTVWSSVNATNLPDLSLCLNAVLVLWEFSNVHVMKLRTLTWSRVLQRLLRNHMPGRKNNLNFVDRHNSQKCFFP